MVLVSRLSQANGHKETHMWATETVLSGLVFCSRSKAMFRVSGSGHSSSFQGEHNFEDRMLSSDNEGKEREEKFESHLSEKLKYNFHTVRVTLLS